MSLPKAFALGGGILLTGLVAAMMIPLAHDIYQGVKRWLLYEETQAPPPPALPPGV